MRVDRGEAEFLGHEGSDLGRIPRPSIGRRRLQARAQAIQKLRRQKPGGRAVAAPAVAQHVGTELVVAAGQLLQPARHEAGHGGDLRHSLPLGQKPDRLIVPRRAGVLARASPPAQFLHAQMFGDVSHVRLPKTMRRLNP
ncbi:hypothetical protein ASF57_22265 [Methylobacterium sp. Leaf117]|nr:hypothetical protein ASF57_22265 [Methylobacterium sp. Leaf117]